MLLFLAPIVLLCLTSVGVVSKVQEINVHTWSDADRASICIFSHLLLHKKQGIFSDSADLAKLLYYSLPGPGRFSLFILWPILVDKWFWSRKLPLACEMSETVVSNIWLLSHFQSVLLNLLRALLVRDASWEENLVTQSKHPGIVRIDRFPDR